MLFLMLGMPLLAHAQSGIEDDSQSHLPPGLVAKEVTDQINQSLSLSRAQYDELLLMHTTEAQLRFEIRMMRRDGHREDARQVEQDLIQMQQDNEQYVAELLGEQKFEQYRQEMESIRAERMPLTVEGDE